MELRRLYPRDMPYGQLWTARRVFATYENKKRKPDRKSFVDFCGSYPLFQVLNMATRNNRNIYWISVSERTYEIVQLCNSPHAHALLTAKWTQEHN